MRSDRRKMANQDKAAKTEGWGRKKEFFPSLKRHFVIFHHKSIGKAKQRDWGASWRQIDSDTHAYTYAYLEVTWISMPSRIAHVRIGIHSHTACLKRLHTCIAPQA